MAVIPKLAASVYLNSAPLVYALAEGSQADRCALLGHTAPARCAALLEVGDVDGALIPAIEYQRIRGVRIAPGVCVGARHRVRSVLLIARRPIESVESVALDTSSRTSAALVHIVFDAFLRREVSYRHADPDLGAMLAVSDAALIIGDPAMTADTRGLHVYDLAQVWRANTDLPFVFALWAVRPEAFAGTSIDFADAKREGLAAAPLLAARYAARLDLDESDLLTYLTDNINYTLDAESLRGLELYYDLAARSSAAPAPRPLDLWSGT